MQERRKTPRIGSLNLTHFCCYDDAGKLMKQGLGRTINMSESGVLLEIHENMPLDQPVTLTVGLEEELVDVTGTIIHQQQMDDGCFRYGVQFDSLSPGARAVVQKFIACFNAR